MSQNHIVWHSHHVTKNERANSKSQKPCILWFTGLSGSGKSTIANGVETKLLQMGKHTYLLDGDNIRHGLNKDLAFDEVSRVENIRRIGELSKLFVDAGLIIISAFISPFRKDRDTVRTLSEKKEFIEIFVDAPIEICEQRDPKKLYEKARLGKIPHFTGISSPYEIPKNPEIHLRTDSSSIEESVQTVIDYLQKEGYLDA